MFVILSLIYEQHERKKGKHSAQTPSEKGVKPSKEVLKRYFANGCTIQEVQTVHEWFATAQGQKYVSKEVDKDFKLIDESFESEYTCDDKIDFAKIFNLIINGMNPGAEPRTLVSEADRMMKLSNFWEQDLKVIAEL